MRKYEETFPQNKKTFCDLFVKKGFHELITLSKKGIVSLQKFYKQENMPNIKILHCSFIWKKFSYVKGKKNLWETIFYVSFLILLEIPV